MNLKPLFSQLNCPSKSIFFLFLIMKLSNQLLLSSFFLIQYSLSLAPREIKTIQNNPFKHTFRCVEDPYSEKFWLTGMHKNSAKLISLDLSKSLEITNSYTTAKPAILFRFEPINKKYFILAGENGAYLRDYSDPESELTLPPAFKNKKIEAVKYIPLTNFFLTSLRLQESVYLSSYITMLEISTKSSPGMPKEINNFYQKPKTDFLCYGNEAPYISTIQYTNMNYVKILVEVTQTVGWIKEGLEKNVFFFISDTSFFSVNFTKGEIIESYLGLTAGKFRLIVNVYGSRIVILFERETPSLICFDLIKGGSAQELWSYQGEHYWESNKKFESYTFCFNHYNNLALIPKGANLQILEDPRTDLNCPSGLNCQKCGYKDNFCVKCFSGFKIKAGNCVEICGGDFFYDSRNNLCKPNPCESPLIYDGIGTCYKCEPNQYHKESTNSCEKCEKKFGTGCLSCNHFQCSSCSGQLILSDQKDKCISCPSSFYQKIDKKCVCTDVRCCNSSNEYFYKQRCHSNSLIPENWGLHKISFGNTIRKCFRGGCKNCKLNYLDCKDPNLLLQKNSFGSFIIQVEKVLESLQNYSVPISSFFSAVSCFFGFKHGSSIAASSQKVQIISYLRFLNIDYGNSAEILWENKNPKIREEIDRTGVKIGDKLNRYGVTHFPNITKKIKLGIYLLTWVLNVVLPQIFIYYGLKRSDKFFIKTKNFLNKIWFGVFNSFLIDFLFSGSRVMLHLKTTKNKFIPYYFFTMMWFTFLITDLMATLKTTLYLKKTEKKELEKEKVNRKDIKKASGLDQIISIINRKFDKNEGKEKIAFENVIENHLLTNLQKNKIKGFDLAKYEKFLHFMRCGIFMFLLVSMQQIVPVCIILLILFELLNLIFIIYVQIKNRSFIWTAFFHKIFSHAGMILFLLAVMDFVYFQNFIDNGNKSAIVSMMALLAIGENFFLILDILRVFYEFAKEKYNEKKIKFEKVKKNRIRNYDPIRLEGSSRNKKINLFQPQSSKIMYNLANKGLKKIPINFVRRNIVNNQKRRSSSRFVNRNSIKISTNKNFEMMTFKKISENRRKINLDKFKNKKRIISVETGPKDKKIEEL